MDDRSATNPSTTFPGEERHASAAGEPSRIDSCINVDRKIQNFRAPRRPAGDISPYSRSRSERHIHPSTSQHKRHPLSNISGKLSALPSCCCDCDFVRIDSISSVHDSCGACTLSSSCLSPSVSSRHLHSLLVNISRSRKFISSCLMNQYY